MPPRRSSRNTPEVGASVAATVTTTAASASISAARNRVVAGVGERVRRKSVVSKKRKNGNKRTVTAGAKRRKSVTARRPLPPGGSLQLSEVGERLVLSYLTYLPERMIAERVCKRWRRLSRDDVPITDLDFSKISMRKVSKTHLKAMLARAAGNLTRVSLPGFSLDDVSMASLKRHSRLKHMRAYTLSRKQIFELLEACTQLESLELLDCQLLVFTRWDPQPASLRTIRFLACHALRTPAVASMITRCGSQLEQLELTGAEYVDSSIFRVMAQHATSLQDLTISYCRAIRVHDVQALLDARCHSLRLLDLTSCSGFETFPSSTELTALEVLILDSTSITDEGLTAIARVASRLKYLSLQDCRGVSDNGVADLVACTALELIDLKGTPVTDAGVEALDAGCPSLQMLRLDSCRSVSRALRLRHGEQTRRLLQRRTTASYERMAVARIATPEQIAAAAAVLTSDSEAANDSDMSYNGR